MKVFRLTRSGPFSVVLRAQEWQEWTAWYSLWKQKEVTAGRAHAENEPEVPTKSLQQQMDIASQQSAARHQPAESSMDWVNWVSGVFIPLDDNNKLFRRRERSAGVGENKSAETRRCYEHRNGAFSIQWSEGAWFAARLQIPPLHPCSIYWGCSGLFSSWSLTWTYKNSRLADRSLSALCLFLRLFYRDRKDCMSCHIILKF